MIPNIYQSLDVQGEKSASLELPHRLDRERPIWKAFWKCPQENYLLCVYPEFTSEISLVISSHDWLTLHALAADKNLFRKVLNGLECKDLFGKLFQSARQNYSSSDLTNCASKVFAYLIKGAQSRYFELFWASTKLLLNWRKPENNTLQINKNIKEIITKHKGTRMVKDGEDWHGLTNNEIEKFSQNFSTVYLWPRPFNCLN